MHFDHIYKSCTTFYRIKFVHTWFQFQFPPSFQANLRLVSTWNKYISSFSPKQNADLDTIGYTLLDAPQYEILYGKDSPYNASEVGVNVTYWKSLTERDKMGELERGIRSIAYDRPRIRRRDDTETVDISNGVAALLEPAIFAPTIMSPSLFGHTTLSPELFSPNILSPYVLGPITLSPFISSPNILTPYVLSPTTLSPALLSPNVLAPTVSDNGNERNILAGT